MYLECHLPPFMVCVRSEVLQPLEHRKFVMSVPLNIFSAFTDKTHEEKEKVYLAMEKVWLLSKCSRKQNLAMYSDTKHPLAFWHLIDQMMFQTGILVSLTNNRTAEFLAY